MTLALVLIVSGILIAIYPEILALIVSFLLILVGLSILFIRYHMKRMHNDWQNPYANFFTRY
ncbi:MAG: hypothetical protein P9M06_00520 [Candidatus Saelkia tenebricola]|nr:hypothetical protein [Candidatus Saelkia tenebricola]